MLDALRPRFVVCVAMTVTLAACEVPPPTAVFEGPAGTAPSAEGAAPAPNPIETGPIVSPIEEAPSPFSTLNEPDLNLVRGYRDPNDPCQLAGESRFTRRYLSDSSDLVACLTGGGAASTLVAERGARPVAQTDSYTLFQVPRS